MQKVAFEATITGRVQMVMYRDFTKRKALALGIVGEVENMVDGSVRVYAEGEEEKLEKFLTSLRKGSLLSQVNNVAYQYREPKGGFESFYIQYN